MGTCTQQAETVGDMSPTQKADRWEPNRQRQVGACIQQVETDGDTFSTGRDRRGQDLIGTQQTRDMYPTGEDRCSSSGDRDRNPTTEANAQQREPARVSEAQVDRQIPRRDMQAGKTHRYPGSQTLDSRADLWVLFCLPEGGERGKGAITCKHPHLGGQTSICGRPSLFLWDFLPRPGGGRLGLT